MKIEELKMDKAEMEIARQRLVQEKTALQSELAEINAQCRVTLPMPKFQKLQSQRGQIIRQVNEKECEISQINIQLRQVNTVVSVKTERKEISKTVIKSFVQMRDKYHEFSMNPDNTQEARRIFWAVSQEIRGILNPYWEMMKQVNESQEP